MKYENINPIDMPITDTGITIGGESIHEVIGFDIHDFAHDGEVVFSGTLDECKYFCSDVEFNAVNRLQKYDLLFEQYKKLCREVADKDEALKIAKSEIAECGKDYNVLFGEYERECNNLTALEKKHTKLQADYEAERASHTIHGEEFRKLERAYEQLNALYDTDVKILEDAIDDLKSNLSTADTAWKHWQTKCQSTEEARKYWHDKYIATLATSYDNENKYKHYLEKFNLRDEQLTDLDNKYQHEVALREMWQKKSVELAKKVTELRFELGELTDYASDLAVDLKEAYDEQSIIGNPNIPKDIILKMCQNGMKNEAIRLVWQSFGYEFEDARQIVLRIMANG